MALAREAVAELMSGMGRVAGALRLRCTGADDRLSTALLDDYQQVCYELAHSRAEVAAVEAVLNYLGDCLERLSQEPSFDKALMFQFVLENVLAATQRLTICSAEVQVEFDDRAEVFGRLRAQLGRFSTAAAIGREICQRECLRLPSGLDQEKELVRETFLRFSDHVVAPQAEDIHRQDLDIPETIIHQAAQLGCFGTCIPERFGGLQPDDQPDSLGMIVVTEELSRGSLGAAGSLITRPEIAARALLAGGSDEQQQRWLPQLASGAKLCAISITEPNTGSDVAAVTLKAKRVDGGWLLNGSKTWCTFAGRSELIVVLARSDPDSTLGHRGLSLFLVEKPAYAGQDFKHEQAAGGALSGRAIATLGYRGMHSFELFFEDYLVPEDNLVGGTDGEGKGFYYTMAGFSGGRIQTAARAIGVMQAAYERALSYAKERQAFGKAVSEYQLTQIKLARMLAAITACRQFSYAVARLMDCGEGQMEASLVKLYCCRAAEWVTREAMQIHGGMGYAEEAAVSRYFVDARVLSIFEGAEETLALKVIARELIASEEVVRV